MRSNDMRSRWNKALPWKHDTKFKSTCAFVANKVFEDILLNVTTVNEALEI